MADFSVKTEDINELVPLGDKVLVAPLSAERISKGGIIIPDTTNQPAMLGHVLAAGPGITTELGALIPMPVKRGDIVAFTRYAGTDVKTTGGSYLLMRQDDLIAIIDPKKRMDDESKDVLIAIMQKELDYAREWSGESHPDEKLAYWEQLTRQEEKEIPA